MVLFLVLFFILPELEHPIQFIPRNDCQRLDLFLVIKFAQNTGILPVHSWRLEIKESLLLVLHLNSPANSIKFL